MEQTPENSLRQAIELAQQAAKQMKKAAKLAENAAQLWQQALVLVTQEDLPSAPEAVQMTVAAPKRPRKQHIKPETTRLIEHSSVRNIPRLAPAPVATESALSARLDQDWEEGDDWWKPRQPIAVAEE